MMNKTLIFFLSLALLLPASLSAQSPIKKSDLKVLYVGGSADISSSGRDASSDVLNASVAKRMKSFEKFLNDYFTHVTVIHADSYVQELSYKYDVTVIDGRPKATFPAYSDYGRDIDLYAGYLSQDFDRPMLTIGEMSNVIGRRVGTKHDQY